MINVPNIDKRMWNLEYKVIEIIAELISTGKADIHLDSEGPDMYELGLIDLLNVVAEKFNIDKNNIRICSRNLLEQSTEYFLSKSIPNFFVRAQILAKNSIPAAKTFDDIKHFGIFIGRSNWQRLLLASHLYNNYKKQLCITFHYDSQTDFHKPNLGFEELAHNIGTAPAINLVSKLLAASPILADMIPSYPIPNEYDIGTLYNNVFIEIVCETYSAGTTFFPTEKIWRPIACRTPFMVQGPVNFLKNLKKLGFKTFDKWIDESYDEDGGLFGINTIQSNIDKLSTLSFNELSNLYKEMQPTINHNFEVFMSLRETHFRKAFL